VKLSAAFTVTIAVNRPKASEYNFTCIIKSVGFHGLLHLHFSLFMILANSFEFSLDCFVITKPNPRSFFS